MNKKINIKNGKLYLYQRFARHGLKVIPLIVTLQQPVLSNTKDITVLKILCHVNGLLFLRVLIYRKCLPKQKGKVLSYLRMSLGKFSFVRALFLQIGPSLYLVDTFALLSIIGGSSGKVNL